MSAIHRVAYSSCDGRSRDPELRRLLVPGYGLSAASGCCSPTTGAPHSTETRRPRDRADLGSARRGADERRHPHGSTRPHLGHRVRRDRLPRGDRRARLRGVSLKDVWADGARAHLGLTVPVSPTCSWSTAPAPTSVAARSSRMLEAPGPAGSPGRTAGRGRRRAPSTGSPCATATSGSVRRQDTRDRLGSGIWAGCDSWYRDGRRITTNWRGLVAGVPAPHRDGRLGRARVVSPRWHHAEGVDHPADAVPVRDAAEPVPRAFGRHLTVPPSARPSNQPRRSRRRRRSARRGRWQAPSMWRGTSAAINSTDSGR